MCGEYRAYCTPHGCVGCSRVYLSSLSARLFEWISSFTKADSGDDHVPLYPKGSQAPSSQ